MCGDCGITSLSCCGEEICLWVTGIGVLVGIIFLGIFFGVKVVPEVENGTWAWYSFAAVLGAIIILFTIILLIKDMCCPKQKFGDMTAIWANPMQPKVEVQINQATTGNTTTNNTPQPVPVTHAPQPVTMTQYHTQYVPVDHTGMVGQPVYMQQPNQQQYYLAPNQPMMTPINMGNMGNGMPQTNNSTGVVYLNQPKVSPRK